MTTSPHNISSNDDVNAIWAAEICDTADHLFKAHYQELVSIARALRRRKQLSDTLLTSDLVHEAFLRLRQTDHWKNEGHFMAAVALSMRHVSIDHARSKSYKKRGGGVAPVEYDDREHGGQSADISSEASIDIHNFLEELTEIDPRQAQIVDCRFFAGFTNQETANILGVDERTVRREWTKARAWFAMRMVPPSGDLHDLG